MNFVDLRCSGFSISRLKRGAAITSVVNVCTHLWPYHHLDSVLGTTT